ncbi:hypothetical protein RJ55_04205 [Drechmeria coniospora]|nr:hypothetical protein RJ55_04205 [Drechmeria coniospora]
MLFRGGCQIDGSLDRSMEVNDVQPQAESTVADDRCTLAASKYKIACCENPSARYPPDSLIRGYDVVTLDDHDHPHHHARVPQIQHSPSGGATEVREARPPWRPIDRYWSDEFHSFPEYGTAKHRMGRDRIRAINKAAGPLDTLSLASPSCPPLPGSSSLSAKSHGHHGSKARPPHKSPYFHPRERDHLGQDDGWEVGITASTASPTTGKSLPNAAAGIHEYRASQASLGKAGSRVRRSRAPSIHQAAKSAIEMHETPGRPLEPASDCSPDMLAIDSTAARTAPSNESQRSLSKRAMQPQSEPSAPPVKRQKPAKADADPIQDSEDELSRGSPLMDRRPKRLTNFSDVSHPRRRTESRADIQRTDFGLPRQQANVSPLTLGPMVLKKAVCGKHIYSSNGQRQNLVGLREHVKGSSRLIPMTPNGAEANFPWLRIDVPAAFALKHASVEGVHVIISRPQVAGFSGSLALEFMSPRGAKALVSMADTAKREETAKLDLEKIFKRAVENAIGYSETNGQGRRDASGTTADGARGDRPPWCAAQDAPEDELKQPRREAGKRAEAVQKSTDVPHRAEPESNAHVDFSTQRRASLRTRRTRPPSPTATPLSPKRWSVQNPAWRTSWQRSLVYPATGKNRATVDDEDIRRLDEGQFLNDNLINFYIRYLQVKLERESPASLNEVYIFSTFFFEKLRSTKGRINYDGVKAWTAKVDLFSYNYVMVPVNENAHWYLAIICNVSGALEGVPDPDVQLVELPSDQSVEIVSTPRSSKTLQASPPANAARAINPHQPKIVTLDSLESPHSPTCRALKEYLIEEARNKKGTELAAIPNGMTAKKIPCQDNFCDCGVFVLGYMEEFLKDPDGMANKLLQREDPGWNIQPSSLRRNVRDLLFTLQAEQQERLDKEKAAKRNAAAQKKALDKGKRLGRQAASISTASPKPSPEIDSLANRPDEGSAGGLPNKSDMANPSPKRKGLPVDADPDLISELGSSPQLTPEDVFFSASESAGGNLRGISPHAHKHSDAGSAGGNELMPSSKPEIVDLEKSMNLLEPLSSSPADGDEGEKSRQPTTATVRQASIEIIKKDPMLLVKQQRAERQTARQKHFYPFSHTSSERVERPARSEAGYDGIDQSVDLTGEI